MKIPLQTIVDLGMLRKQNKCANCKKKMDVKDYNIQLCKKCRQIALDMNTLEILEELNKTSKIK